MDNFTFFVYFFFIFLIFTVDKIVRKRKMWIIFPKCKYLFLKKHEIYPQTYVLSYAWYNVIHYIHAQYKCIKISPFAKKELVFYR